MSPSRTNEPLRTTEIAGSSVKAGLSLEIDRLEQRNAELERSNEDLDRFAMLASHDLREPLRMITTYAQLLAEKYGSVLDGEAAMCIDTIVEGAGRMRELLTDLLAYGEVDSHLQEDPEPVDLNGIVETATQNLKASIEEAHAAIACDPLPVLNGRSSDFTRLFQNLLANAIKYRNEHAPRIHVGVQREEGNLLFCVSDNGIGIDASWHQEIFEPFKRLHSKSIPGTGLGLAICQRVVSRYGGRIWVESRKGDGAKFLFTLPAAIPSSAVDRG